MPWWVGGRGVSEGGRVKVADGASAGPAGGGPAEGGPVPRVLFETATLETLDPATAGAVWRLAEPGRQVDANVVRIPPERAVDPHTETDLDVLLLVVAGDGTLVTSEETRPLSEGSLAWLPHGSTRGLVAGKRGMAYLTVHRRRPGMRIQPASASRDPQP
ncbi:cupin domain-containing protein [Streptomyces sp. NPDC056222]|uniref:cupin domain-containing protein n=1 Tax=Streptomyces sp. NPDC056222 TaxID=3345749 RepID=UPI0035DD8DF4